MPKWLSLAFSLFVSTASSFGATPVVSEVLPPHEQISCRHLNSRIKVERQLLDMLPLLSDMNQATDFRQTEEFISYLGERSGIPLSLLLHRDVFQIRESLEFGSLPVAGDNIQALAVVKTGVVDYPDPYGRFNLIDFKIRKDSEVWQLEYGASAADICLRGAIDLVLYWSCPMDDFQFHECEKSGICLRPVVTRPWACRERATVHLRLETLQSKLGRRGRVIRRRGPK